MIKQVKVELGDRSYNINVGSEFEMLCDGGGRAALMVSDSNVDPLYGDICAELLRKHGFTVARAVVPAGESTKSLEKAADLFEAAVEAHLDRKSCIVALGGGVVGDLAGFVAGTYLRGVSLIQVPTSLLAMVDSSVGGKTAVNLPQGKNLVGVFHQPLEVIINLETLETLPEREYISGLAEVVKYGVIMDAEFFELLEANAEALLKRERTVLAEIVGRCCEIKAEVVGADEREGGLRAILNYGHTLGHAIENSCGYGELLHGEAVALGMVYAGILSVQSRGLNGTAAQRIVELMRRLKLPVDKSALPRELSWEKLRDIMSADKKAERAIPSFVLASEVGKVDFGCKIGEESLRQAWLDFPEGQKA
jgi:3-dehydroquinate synthase